MTEIILHTYRLRVDAEATRAYYAARPCPDITCDCAGCRNYTAAVQLMPQTVRAFLAGLGLVPEKPAELCYYAGTEETLSGGGWYHICGELLAGGPEEGSREALGQWIELGDGFAVAFKSGCDLLPKDFPRPCFQMELGHRLPWVLNEPNPYIP